MKVGKIYDVLSIRGDIDSNVVLSVPIIGPKHNDAEVIKFYDEHWHIDWRFASHRLLIAVRVSANDMATGKCFSKVLSVGKSGNFVPFEEVKMVRRRCIRPMPLFPTHYTPLFGSSREVPWMRELEDKYADTVLSGRICPHRGFQLEGESDCVTCPGHGLCWNLKTGRLVRRMQSTSS